MRRLGFASVLQARHNGRPNRVHLRYGLIVHLRLLPTPPRGDAVTFGYGVPEHPGKDFHLADSMQLQAHKTGAFCPSHTEHAFTGQTKVDGSVAFSQIRHRPPQT
jgi:hypothetical protein